MPSNFILDEATEERTRAPDGQRSLTWHVIYAPTDEEIENDTVEETRIAFENELEESCEYAAGFEEVGESNRLHYHYAVWLLRERRSANLRRSWKLGGASPKWKFQICRSNGRYDSHAWKMLLSYVHKDDCQIYSHGLLQGSMPDFMPWDPSQQQSRPSRRRDTKVLNPSNWIWRIYYYCKEKHIDDAETGVKAWLSEEDNFPTGYPLRNYEAGLEYINNKLRSRPIDNVRALLGVVEFMQ